MKALRDKTTGKLTIKVKKDEDSPETRFGKELQKSAQHKKNEEYAKDLKIETGLNKNMISSRKSGQRVSENKIVFDK